ncbi:hypothetical protein CWB58_16920 [Pseudoalteromonas sp. S201]|uniref:DUF2326 domain-containing protein n=2 Tax=Pseudoalteromonas TaxID=53246 RepID=UPI00110CCB47|nr:MULTISPECIES: DUF2326 domain-containing protein [unclassified Pseudoalteromonas]TMS61173.1 hypothetical protein CWC10_13255 [Pseudoalteromonas sp. S3173]TMS91959.1 hypothetical protein CWB58_16920 [Pseudoalteromonas sp. S201]
MFKLISLESPSGLFQPIIFKDGLNIILGRYSTTGKDINGIGKTTIINFIDFCLLSDGVKQELFSEKFSFIKSESVKLVFSINNDTYSITRNFEDRQLVKFQKNNQTTRELTDTDLRLILGAEIGKGLEGVYDPQWYRTLLSFFVQNDHNLSQRDASNPIKFSVGKRQPELFTYLFLLLGIDNNLIWQYDNSSVELKNFRADQTRINKQILEQTGKSVDDFKSDCDIVARKIDKLEKGLENYQFGENTQDLEGKIKNLNARISHLNKEHLYIATKFKDLQESLKIAIDVDPEEVSVLFSQMHSEFSKFIKKSLDEVVQFRKQISSNRNRFLKERESQYQNKLESIQSEVAALETERSKFYKMLDELSAFDALKNAYNNLVEEKANLSGQLSYVEQLDYIENAIATKKSSVSKTVAEIVKNKDKLECVVEGIKEVFLDLVDGSVDTDSSDTNPYFNIEAKAKQNSPLKLTIEVPRGGSLGKGRFKILAFDMTVFISSLYRNKNLPSFLIHDGVFHAIAHKTRIKYLNYINRRLSTIKGAQYIVTVNEDEILFPDSEGVNVELDFDLNERTLITLEDNPQSMFLGRDFG